MYKCLYTLIFLTQSVYALNLKDLVHLSEKAKLNSEIFDERGFWKNKTQESFWNNLGTFRQQGKTYCLLYRFLKTRSKNTESLLIVEKINENDCLESIDRPLWSSGEVDQIKIQSSSKEFFLSFVKDSQFHQFQFKWLNQLYKGSGLTIFKEQPRKSVFDFSSPCLQLDKNCKSVVRNNCHDCPYGVIGFFNKKSCAGQSLFCRRDKECGVSEKEACQQSPEEAIGCELRKRSYFCREHLNMVCEKGRIVCY